MAHFAILSTLYAGHLLPILSLCREVQGRGHRCTVISHKDAESSVRDFGMDFRPLPDSHRDYRRFSPLAALAPLVGLGYHAHLRDHIRRTALRWLDDAPPIIETLDADALIVDQFVAAGGTIAEQMGLPYATLSTALDWWEDPAVPPNYTRWGCAQGFAARMRNRAGYGLWRFFIGPAMGAINRRRAELGLKLLRHPNELLSDRAQIVQSCEVFDFRRALFPSVRYGGCLSCSDARVDAGFPWDRLDGRPVVFASLGTISTRRNARVLERIAAACARLPVQLVLSLGRWSHGQEQRTRRWAFAGDPLLVDYAPQLPLLEKATLMVNHGGLNSVMEALSCGVPQVVCPRAHDQFGTAARALHAGVALYHSFHRGSERSLVHAIARVLEEESFRDRARFLQRELAATGGNRESAAFLESALL